MEHVFISAVKWPLSPASAMHVFARSPPQSLQLQETRRWRDFTAVTAWPGIRRFGTYTARRRQNGRRLFRSCAASYGLWFICWFQSYINRLLTYILSSLLTYLLT